MRIFHHRTLDNVSITPKRMQRTLTPSDQGVLSNLITRAGWGGEVVVALWPPDVLGVL